MANPVEAWKSQRHRFDIWPGVSRWARGAHSDSRNRDAQIRTREAVWVVLSQTRWRCGITPKMPGDYMQALRESLIAAGFPATRLHKQQFQITRPSAVSAS